MPVKLKTTLANIKNKVKNPNNLSLINEFYAYLKSNDTSENYQNGLLKALVNSADFIGPHVV